VYAKLEGNLVVQIQPNEEVGFVPVTPDVLPGMELVGDKYRPPTGSLLLAKQHKLAELRQDFVEVSNANVVIDGNTYYGGKESAASLQSVIDLAIMAKEKEVVFFNVLDMESRLTIPKAKKIAVRIGLKYQNDLITYKNLKRKVNSAKDIKSVKDI